MNYDETVAKIEENTKNEIQLALEMALPLLIKLGDFTGNADGRFDAVLAVRKALDKFKSGVWSGKSDGA